MKRFLVFLILCMAVTRLLSRTLPPASPASLAQQVKKVDSIVGKWQRSVHLEIVSVDRALADSGSIRSELGGFGEVVKANSNNVSNGQAGFRQSERSIVSCDHEASVFHWHLTIAPDQGFTRSARTPN